MVRYETSSYTIQEEPKAASQEHAPLVSAKTDLLNTSVNESKVMKLWVLLLFFA